MTGYTRQSVADIINGLEVTAPPLNAEFNQVAAAFNASTGHSHDGSTGNAPPINLVTSIIGYLPLGNGGVGGRNNVAASNPLITNDGTQGYAPGSIWINSSTGRVYVCVGNTTAAAVWREEVQVQGGNAIIPASGNTVDIGASGTRFKDAFLNTVNTSGNGTIGGTFTVSGNSTFSTTNTTGLATLAQVDVNSGTIDGTVIGGSTPSPVTGTTITANSGFIGNVTGNVSGNVTSTGTSTFNNLTASGTITGNVSGNVTGDVTSSGASSFNNVTITGTLNMDLGTVGTITGLASPVNVSDAANKGYVDTRFTDLIGSAPGALDTLNELATALGNDSNFATTMATALAGKVNDTGDTITGNLVMTNGATVTGIPTPVNPTDTASKAYVDARDVEQVSRTGDSMSGVLSMGLNKIINLGDPTSSTDAANKQYVDAILGSATAAAVSAAAAATSEANTDISEANALQAELDARAWAIKLDGPVENGEYSAKYWATQAAVSTVATNIASVNTVAGIVASVNSVAGSLVAVEAVASNLTDINAFNKTYTIGPDEPFGANLTFGDLWFDTVVSSLKVYTANGWINAGSSVNGIAERRDYVVGYAKGLYDGLSNTTFPAQYEPGFVDVFLNGVKLAPTDYTSNDRQNIVLASAAAFGDEVSITSFGSFQLADTYTRSQSDLIRAELEERIVALEDDAILNLGVI